MDTQVKSARTSTEYLLEVPWSHWQGKKWEKPCRPNLIVGSARTEKMSGGTLSAGCRHRVQVPHFHCWGGCLVLWPKGFLWLFRDSCAGPCHKVSQASFPLSVTTISSLWTSIKVETLVYYMSTFCETHQLNRGPFLMHFSMDQTPLELLSSPIQLGVDAPIRCRISQ